MKNIERWNDFACAALNGILSHPSNHTDGHGDCQAHSSWAACYADAMELEALKRESEGDKKCVHQTISESLPIVDSPAPKPEPQGVGVIHSPIVDMLTKTVRPQMPLDKRRVMEIAVDMDNTLTVRPPHFLTRMRELTQKLTTLCQPREVTDEEVERVSREIHPKMPQSYPHGFDDCQFKQVIFDVVRVILTNQPKQDDGKI